MLTQRLRGVPWFATCTDDQLHEIARIAERLHVHEGEVVLREGRLGRELFILLDGTVVVTRAGRVVNEWGPGDYFGELAAIDRAAQCDGDGDLGPRRAHRGAPRVRRHDGNPGLPQRCLARHEPAHPRGRRQVGGHCGA